jgi:pimeloyl-ACP methyl ester carboxylesterase
MREYVKSADGTTISYSKYGSGPPLVLVHGGFSDDISNWELVRPMFEPRFTVHAIARRGRGQTEATAGHTLDDEAKDVTSVITAIREPVFLVGHSYGAQCSLEAAAQVPNLIRKLVLYEPPSPQVISPEQLQKLQNLAAARAWDDLANTFFREILLVPEEEFLKMRQSPGWSFIVSDAKASFGDIQALGIREFDPQRFRHLRFPVLLQVGTESPRHLYVTDALAAVLPAVRIEELPGQAHEAMTTAPEMYAKAVIRFLSN